MQITDQEIKDNHEIYLHFLRFFNEYSNKEFKWDEDGFIYDYRDTRLTKLREDYRLECVAGKHNNEILRLLNIMRWANEMLRHKRTGDFPESSINALNILKFSREKRVTVNCAMHSIVLTEALLSLGYPARSISCLPMDIEVSDSHAICVAYSKSLSKWIALDPSFSIYVTDLNNNILDLNEIRNKIIQGEDITINQYKRINTSDFDTNWYKSYLTKNLFRFACNQKTNFNHLSSNEHIVYFLHPYNYLPNNNTEAVKKMNDITFKYRYISNPSFFWSIP
ncbi:transglutaminase-like domain-containing protein [Paenibacillus pseudetheri]|uniref:Transglutaminase-like domain-containing protein n=1 Tax=Paenibacillus pseudetheri TaxID=2897682 RepID=A0ABM9BGF0_9BACL|nr:transglutaminase-like domain-containing protein [Paenibacillus pseudetheri]CAH1057577.1 hypothetical protein PAECIP111894_03735 [Paenibacillus pseudetheri]